LNISAAILSRFDLLFILLDQNNEDMDRMLASHIVKVHQRKDKALDPPYSTATLQRYIKAGKALKPQVSQNDSLIKNYSWNLKHKSCS
jgi:DNA replication licensing factor MCM6